MVRLAENEPMGVIQMEQFRLTLSAPWIAAIVLASWTGMTVSAQASCSSSPSDGVNWADCRKRNLILEGATLTNANLSGADLTSTDLRGSKLDGANLEKATLLRTYMNGSTITGANFTKSVGYRTHFDGADLSDTNLEKSEMQRADFRNTNLTNTNFSKAELGRANFDNAIVENVNFEFANLARADFRTTKLSGQNDFTGSFLFLTRFEGQDISQAKGLVQSQIDIACGDEKTVLPEGLGPSANWPCEDDS